ncbi:MAG: gliding motility-associated C-terminal domain-containing protein [Muribaculum sp.]|nr:gliding motility-associated C-terminal domain-containing protein [Muribaculaceae bacterium]MCM1081057.1 gliding motility-associated C-terminal domain-containing protein [Muribaculum sp.]
MKKKLIALIITIFAESLNIFASEISFSGNSVPVVEINPEASTGLNKIYVLHNAAGVSASYVSTSGNKPTWLKYGTRGGGFAEPVEVSYSGTISTLNNVEGDCGYIIEDGASRMYFWIVDYSRHEFSIDNLQIGLESDCSTVTLNFTGSASPIYYTTINGQNKELSRNIELGYNTLEFDMDTKNYNYKEVVKQLEHISNTILVESPYTDTRFVISGDRFLKTWGTEVSYETSDYKAVAVGCFAEAEQVERNADNEQSSGSSGSLGGSAPAEVEFRAWVTDAVVFKEWQISRDSEFDIITFRDNNQDFNYTFREEGNFYVRFATANADGSCTAYSQSFDVTIGESDIKCPNAFSPGNEDGVNDIWKVSYKSIVSFNCHIFNRWGQRVCSFTNPSDGWDGKYKGKLVPSGVYYYVISAKGADGRSYNLKGDINIINEGKNRTGGNLNN